MPNTYLSITFLHSTDPEVDGNLTREEALKLVKASATKTRKVGNKEFFRNEYRGTVYSELYFETTTYHIVSEEYQDWDLVDLVNNIDFSQYHNLGKRFDNSLITDGGVRFVRKLPTGVEAIALPSLSQSQSA